MPKNKRNRHRKSREWRGIDASEAESLSTNKTTEILQGGKLSDRRDDLLFFVDKNQPTKPLTAKEKKEKARGKELYIDKLLAPNPHTKAETIGPQPKKSLHKNVKKRKADDVTPKNPTSDYFDLWAGVGDKMDVEKKETETLVSFQAPKARSGFTAPSKRQHIEAIDAGASYNPAKEDHQELLGKAVAYHQRIIDNQNKMKKLMKRSKTVEQETVDVIPGMEEEARQITDDTGVVSDSESDDLPTEQKHVNKPHIEAKTKQDRNKERRRRLHEAQFRRSQWKKRQRAEWNRLGEIIAEVDQETAVLEQRQQAKLAHKSGKEGMDIKRLGKMKFTEEEPDYLLTEELPGSLRRLPTGKFNIIKDRFKSLQRRNLIETRAPKAKTNRYEKKLVEKYSSRVATASEDMYTGKK